MGTAEKPTQGDEGLLFLEFNEQLLQRVSSIVSAPRQTVEDACAFAWMQFLRYQPDRDGEWKSWLVRTAQREAWRLHRTSRDVPAAPIGPTRSAEWSSEPADPRDPIETNDDLNEVLAVLGELPPRLRRIAFLRASGLRYDEIGAITGDSFSRVTTLVRRSNEKLYEAIGELRTDERELPPRARRLRELENEPPTWLLKELGPVPQSRGGRVACAAQRLQWRRAALAIEDYRRLSGFGDPQSGLGPRSAEPLAALAHDVARRAIDQLGCSRSGERELG